MSMHAQDYKDAATKAAAYAKTHVWVWVGAALIAGMVIGKLAGL